MLDEARVWRRRGVTQVCCHLHLHAQHPNVIQAVWLRWYGARKADPAASSDLREQFRVVNDILDVLSVWVWDDCHARNGIPDHERGVLPPLDKEMLVVLLICKAVYTRWKAATVRLEKAHSNHNALNVVNLNLHI